MVIREIIDILKVSKEDGVPKYWRKFTVDNTVDSVPVETDDDSTSRLSNPTGEIFTAGDTMEILSMGFKMPSGYTLVGQAEPFQQRSIILAQLSVGASFPLPVFNSYYMFENYEHAIGQYIPMIAELDFTLEMYIDEIGDVSMLNVPDSENGKTYYIEPFAKIRHSINLEAYSE